MKAVTARASCNATLLRELFSDPGNAEDTVRKILEARRTSALAFIAHDGRVISTIRIIRKRHRHRSLQRLRPAFAALRFVVAKLIAELRP